ncbi:DUF6415 family natural product biosynthesis protein [Streptomyces rubradiris]|uniref:DUF6415 family natural product biosynthesis protein n=1 Tax=Streptomyces rubradiris TaxID=285531 RepID=UPI001E526D96|nr:DUF6415 family natural product biosynthesis protein [Streptomyces rubradiris]
MTSPAFDEEQILAATGLVLDWDLDGSSLPPVDEALGLVEQFTTFGRDLAGDLRDLCLGLPDDSRVGQAAHVTLGEASGRLYLPPPAGTPRAAAHRAQNLARLFEALLRAVEAVSNERDRTGRHQHSAAKGIR